MQKEYTDEFKEKIIKKLENGEHISHLSKEFGVSKKVLNEWYSYILENRRDKRYCSKKYTAYKAHIEEKKGSVLDSKVGGIPYIHKDEKWITCQNCQTYMPLVLQLNIQELPEVPKGLEEWGFVQVYSCLFPYYAENESDKCYQLGGYFREYGEEGKPFNRAFQIELKRDKKEAQSFSTPPWFEQYSLKYDEETEKISSLVRNDTRDIRWAESHLNKEKIIVSWSQEDARCTDSNPHKETSVIDWENLQNDVLKPRVACTTNGCDFDLFGIVSSSELDNRAEGHGENPKCICCSEYMVLLFQFSMYSTRFYKEGIIIEREFGIQSDGRQKGDRIEEIYALYYCPEHPELMSCQWVSIKK